MLNVRSLVVFVSVAAAFAPVVVVANLWDNIAAHTRRPMVQIFWEKALTPCTCEHQILNCSDRSLFNIVQEHLCLDATTVDISSNQISIYPVGLNHATVVNVSSNRLSALPPIERLNPGIKVLDVSANRIEYGTESYQSLGLLEELTLSWNKEMSLSFLPNPCGLKILKAIYVKLNNVEHLRECHHLKEINLEGNEISSLPSDIFSTHTKLQKLTLVDNPIRSIMLEHLANLTQLKVLRLIAIDLDTLTDHVFDSLIHLQHLDLSNNKLRSLPSRIFSGLSRLSILNLAGNKFDTLPIEVFQDFQALREINLSNNKLKIIPDRAFSSLLNIKEVHISFNEITSIGDDLFSNETHVEGFVFNDNPMSNLSHGVFRYYHLDIVFLPCLDNNEDLSEFNGAKAIYISKCGETHWEPRAYASLSSVVRLVISNHKVLSIANATFDGLPALKMLEISHDEITSLPESLFLYTPNLTILSLYENNLTSLPERIFSGLIHVQDIILETNKLRSLPENLFQGLPSLERIDITRNQLTSIPRGLFNNLPSLNEISLEGNKLTTLPPLESSWPQLQKVSFSLNKMTEVPTTALRSWLNAETAPRFVSLVEEIGYGADPRSFNWLLLEPGVKLGRGSEFNCRCGSIRKGPALIFTCVNATCPLAGSAPAGSWVDVLRAAGDSDANALETHTDAHR